MNRSNRAAGGSSGVVGLLALAVSAALVAAVEAGELRFQHHFVARELPVNARGHGDYGMAALLDVDRDGDLDFVLGGRAVKPPELYWFEYQAPDRWVKHLVGTDYGSDVELAALDVDRDGWTDLVCSGVWYRNPGRPREQPFERLIFARGAGGAHDVLAHTNIPMGRKGPFGVCVRTVVTDMDGDGKQEVVICDADIADSKVAILTNVDGKGRQWSKRELSLSFPYGSLHSLAVADFNNDGRKDILVCEQEELLPAGRKNPRFVIFENQGNRFAERIILDARLGGHEAVIGDLDGDGDLDICSKAWGPLPWNANGGKMHADYLENLLLRKP